MNETKVYSRASVFAWLETQAVFVPEAAIALMWVRNPDRWKSERRPYLLRARVAGDTIRDLIEALQQLDPDLKHGVEEVWRDRTRCDGLGGDRTIARLQQEVADETEWRKRLEDALRRIVNSEVSTADELRDIAAGELV